MGPDVTKKFIQSTKLLRAHITEDKESYIDLENRFSQYKAENDVRFENLKDMVVSLRSSRCTTTSIVNVERSRIAVAHILDFHKNIVATGRAYLILGLQESEEAECEVIVDIIFEKNSSVFGQRGVFFDERLIGTKIKYPMILLCFTYLLHGDKLEAFVKKFLGLARKVDNLDQKIVVAAFTNALQLDYKAKEHLFLNKPPTLEDLITKVYSYVDLERMMSERQKSTKSALSTKCPSTDRSTERKEKQEDQKYTKGNTGYPQKGGPPNKPILPKMSI
ncbi:hypothetical protein GIB67_022427 [Kingdonia uniflora]|uniref:Uncharacterized protein n=1 Tax=Kingdonia uniflora TaxID=39325 RepID=A0A7J7MU52_9MAGN|nr:hypothetical protein GIB67_022427 [Kingdonia uniflora]